MATVTPIKFTWKRGGTFSLRMRHTTQDKNVGIDITDIDITSHLRGANGALIVALQVEKYDQSNPLTRGCFRLYASGDTRYWPVGTASMDIRMQQVAVVTHSKTIYVDIEQGPTHV